MERRLDDFLKRVFDITASGVGLILLFPLMLVLAFMIKRKDGGPVFYRGVRVGKNGKPFRIFKFRTMVVGAENTGCSSTAEDDSRLTGTGKTFRQYKLDELPQLLNVLKGEMSIVGPRPQVSWAVALYTSQERAVLKVRPGITDYASEKFHNEEEILAGSADPDRLYMEKIHPEKMRLAMEYVNNYSFLTDLKIIFLTITTIIKTRKKEKYA